MTDFVRRVLRPEHPDWIIRSLLDVDFYKFTMGYFIWKFYRGVEVEFKFINRHLYIPVADIIDEGELRRELDHVRTLRLRRTDIYYLRGMDIYGEAMFPDEYLEFLAKLQMSPYKLVRDGQQYRLSFTGPWEIVTFWETIALAIISELFYRKLLASMAEMGSASETNLRVLYARATDKIYGKLRRLKGYPNIRFADFGQRRRHSFLWQQFVIQMAQEVMGRQFTGTSNTWMAFNQDLVPIGTNAHELPMVLTALADTDEEKHDAQYEVLRRWGALFPQKALRIMLPDTYGSRQFFKQMPRDLAPVIAREWRGMRSDSGSPIEEGSLFLDWLKEYDASPKERLLIPSDGLDVESMVNIDSYFLDKTDVSYGWGTKFTNDFDGCHPRGNERAVINGRGASLTWDELLTGHSFVCKVASANGKPAIKLSNNPNKATGPKEEIERYKRIFGVEGQVRQEVVV